MKLLKYKTINSRIRRAAFKRRYCIQKLSAENELKGFLTRFREKYVSCNLIRVGGEEDGGYLLPDNLKEISYCFRAC